MTDEDRSEAIASTAGAALRAYVALRENGRRLASAWGPGATALDAVLAATGSARDGLSPAEVERATALEVCVAHSFRPVPPARFRRERTSPTSMVPSGPSIARRRGPTTRTSTPARRSSCGGRS